MHRHFKSRSSPASNSLPRLFVGLSLPPPVVNSLQTLVQPNALPHARWLAPSTWHVTLHFLGSVPVPVVQSALETVSTVPFDLKLNSAGIFCTATRPRILWAGVETNPGLLAMHAAIGEKLAAAGFPLEKRQYSPHVSIAKVKCKNKKEEGMSWTFAEDNVDYESPIFKVRSFTLFESVLSSNGVVYASRGEYMANGDLKTAQ